MWFFNKHRKNTLPEPGIKMTETLQIKNVSSEWDKLCIELTFVQQAFDAEQTAYKNAINNLSKQRHILSESFEDLNEMKAELSEYLKHNRINVVVFKRLSDECVVAYLHYEHEYQILADMEYEFNASYSEWETRFESRLSKISELKNSIKALENEIKDLCIDI